MSALPDQSQVATSVCTIVGTCGHCMGAMLLKAPSTAGVLSRPTCSNCGCVQKPVIGSKGQFGIVMDVTAP